jgi:hypothetical protein
MKPIIPARITLALDTAGLHGPEVDVNLGGTEPMVDDWETGKTVPTEAQIKRISIITGYPESFFSKPVDDAQMTICGRHGCEIIVSHVDDAGVLHVEGHTPVKKSAAPGEPHLFQPDQRTISVCAICQMPRANQRHRGNHD